MPIWRAARTPTQQLEGAIAERKQLVPVHADSFEAVGTLTDRVAHNFNNLLTAVVARR